MFGVFDGYEQQLLRDWILADAGGPQGARTTNRFRRRPTAEHVEAREVSTSATSSVQQIIAHHAGQKRRSDHCADVDSLFAHLEGIDTKSQAFNVLEGLLSPANHPTPAGLAATRLYADLFNR